MDDSKRGGKDTAPIEPGAPQRDLPGALHEVSNALTVVLGWIDSARELSGEGSEAGRALDIAATRARHARHIVRRAIGAHVPEEAPTPIGQVVSDAVVGLEPEARRAGLSLMMEIDPRCSGVLIESASSALQVLTNLILNAIAASPHGGAIAVDVTRSGAGALVIGVSDEGPGIASDRRATIIEAGVSTRPGGAGIGLRHAAALAREAGGALSLADGSPGARFELRWPYGRVDLRPAPTSATGASAALAGARVLVVEDDDAVIALIEVALSARGATVVAIKRSRDLAGALQSGAFDAALFDMSPIEDDVAGALRAVRQSSPNARLIVISGSAATLPVLPRECQPTWIRKPFEISELVRALVPARAGSKAVR